MSAALSIDHFRTAGELQQIMLSPDVWPWVSDDGADHATFTVPAELIARPWVYAVRVNGIAAGFAMMEPRNTAMSEFHGAVLTGYRRLGILLARMALARWWEEHGAEKLVALCPEGNRLGQRMNALLGMQREGRITGAWMRGGRLEDLIVYGLSREGG